MQDPSPELPDKGRSTKILCLDEIFLNRQSWFAFAVRKTIMWAYGPMRMGQVYVMGGEKDQKSVGSVYVFFQKSK